LKSLKTHWITGPLSWLLSAALCLPVWLAVGGAFLAAPRAAQAQTLNRAPLWAVVPFENESGYGQADIGVQASDGFVVELSKTNKYDVVSRSDTQQAISSNGLVEPLDTIGLQQLSRDLDADAVATGTVKTIAFTSNPRRAIVSVVIRVVDKISGELINGAVATGTSTPRAIPDNDDDALVDQAIENADFDAVKQITTFNLPRATVLIHQDPGTVTLNKGTQDGLYNGLNMLVTRNGSEVGRVRVSDASADESYATVVQQGLGIQPQDVATAIYALPSYTVVDNRLHVGAIDNTAPSNDDYLPHNSSRNLFTGAGGVLVALGAAVGLVALASNGHGSSSSGTNALGGGRTGGVTANLDPNPVTLAQIDPFSNASSNGNFVPLRIAINFSPGQLGDYAGTIEYHIYRNPQPDLLVGTNFVPVTSAIGGVGRIPAFSPASPSGTYDSADELPIVAVYKPTSLDDHIVDFSVFYTVPAGATTPELPLISTGLNVGDRVNYTVEGLYAVTDITTGTSPGGTLVDQGTPIISTNTSTSTSTGSTSTTGTASSGTAASSTTGVIYSLSETVDSNYVTYLQPVILRSTNASFYPLPPANTNSATPTTDSYFASNGPSSVNVTVDSVFGGTATTLAYALEFSTDPAFGSNVARYTATVPNSGQSVNFREGQAFSFGNINLRSISAFQNATAIYVRVGVRDTRDGDESQSPYLWSTVDLNQGIGGTLPSYLLPSNPAAPAAKKALVATNGVTVLTPKFSFITHRQAPAIGADVPAIALNSARPFLTPSETPHATISQTEHPTAGGSNGGLRPTH
jgi:hypothetical protein